MKNLMRTKWMRLVFGCTLAFLACVSITFGQTVTGAITGEVKDPTGAVVSGAQVWPTISTRA